jgi:hypothetical protein
MVAALTGAGLVAVAAAEPSGLKSLGLLNGHEEVDAAGHPNNGDVGAAGYVVAHIDSSAHQVCVDEFQTGGLTAPIILFHIHKAPEGQNGPIVVDFVPLLPAGTGCVTVADRRLLSDIKRAPKKFYFNVHTTAFPNGAIRGQIRHLARN